MDYDDIKKVIYRLDPETAHNLVEFTLHNLSRFTPFLLDTLASFYTVSDPRLEVRTLGCTFPNPVGMAAGFDKNATMIEALRALGFGFVEFGTLTPRPQSGNPKPRLFRYPEYESLQNAMGFNNDGMTAICRRVAKLYPYRIPLGANIGKNKTTPEDKAIDDYRTLIEKCAPISDYLVINISSPNTPGLRDLQNETFIKELFTTATALTNKPILLKIAPDLSAQEALKICESALAHKAAGIIATNTTIDYTLLPGARNFGGISGRVLKEKSFALFDTLAKAFYGHTVLISVGGIDSAEEAYRRILAGASLVQIYSALIFKGPALAGEINRGLLRLLERDGFGSIEEATGAKRS